MQTCQKSPECCKQGWVVEEAEEVKAVGVAEVAELAVLTSMEKHFSPRTAIPLRAGVAAGAAGAWAAGVKLVWPAAGCGSPCLLAR